MKKPIGVFDSGLGGLTAVAELKRLLPCEDIVYFGDTARVPYGTRGRDTIIKYTRQAVHFLHGLDIKALVIACGTASSVALDVLKAEFDFPILGVVDAAARAAARATKSNRVGIIGTRATVLSRSYESALAAINRDIQTSARACPLFVPIIEDGRVENDEILRLAANEYLSDFCVDTLIMGCTHYPLIEKTISSVVGKNVTLINPGAEAARSLAETLSGERDEEGVCKFFVSDDTASFSRNASIFLGSNIDGVVSLAEMSV